MDAQRKERKERKGGKKGNGRKYHHHVEYTKE